MEPVRLAQRARREDIPASGCFGRNNLVVLTSQYATMNDQDERELLSELARLQQEHRDLDAAIDALLQSPAPIS